MTAEIIACSTEHMSVSSRYLQNEREEDRWRDG